MCQTSSARSTTYQKGRASKDIYLYIKFQVGYSLRKIKLGRVASKKATIYNLQAKKAEINLPCEIEVLHILLSQREPKSIQYAKPLFLLM